MAFAVAEDVVRLDRTCGCRACDERHGCLSPPRMRCGDDGAFRHPRHHQHHSLDLAWIDVHPSGDDQIGPSVDDVHIAVGIDAAQIAGVVPAVAERVVAGLRVVSVPGGQRCGMCDQLADGATVVWQRIARIVDEHDGGVGRRAAGRVEDLRFRIEIVRRDCGGQEST